jgi:hypothetical protein
MKHFLFIFSFIIFNQSANAQDGERFERVEAILVAHITKSLDLSSAEAEKFWPVFNEFSKTEFELRVSQRKIMRVINTKLESLSDKEISDYNLKIDKIREDLYKNENDLYKDLKGILSDKKILKLKFARENFQRHLLQQIRQNRKG